MIRRMLNCIVLRFTTSVVVMLLGVASDVSFGADACFPVQEMITFTVKEIHATSDVSNDSAWVFGSGSVGGTSYPKLGIVFYLPSEQNKAATGSGDPYSFTDLRLLREKQAGHAQNCLQVAQQAFVTGQKMSVRFHKMSNSIKARVDNINGVCTESSVMTPTNNDVIAPADCVLSKY